MSSPYKKRNVQTAELARAWTPAKKKTTDTGMCPWSPCLRDSNYLNAGTLREGINPVPTKPTPERETFKMVELALTINDLFNQS
jgi:hypothetical protein